MSGENGNARQLLAPALLLGLAGDLLFRAQGLGLNLTLWTAGLMLGWLLLRRRVGAVLTEPERGLLLAGLVLAGFMLWRANGMLHFLDGIALVGVIGLLPLAALPEESRDLFRLRVGEALSALADLLWRLAGGLLPASADALRASRQLRARAPLLAVARGALFTIPTLFLFGGLLGSADPHFGDLLTDLFRPDVGQIINHSLGVVAGAWVAAAALAGVLSLSRAPFWGIAAAKASFGGIEVGLLLGTMNLLFAGFIAFQIPYFFGGEAFVTRLHGITYAEYARRGFFELVVVSALVLPLLLWVDSRIANLADSGGRLFRWLAGAQVVLVLFIMGSAMHRMWLYQRQYGLTEDRFFASAFMAGLAVTCGWFALTVLRGAGARFLSGSLLAWSVWLALLHVVNPDRIIVETNLRRAEAGQDLDVAYLSRLSPDAIPTLVARLDQLPSGDRAELARALWSRHDLAPFRARDWRSWHPARARAETLVARLDSSFFGRSQ